MEEPEESFALQETWPRETPPKETQTKEPQTKEPQALATATAPTVDATQNEMPQESLSAPEMAKANAMSKAADLSPIESAISLNSVGAALAEALRKDKKAELKPVAEDGGEVKAAVDENAIDPWDDPLPAWEYSRNEWPIALVDEKPSALQRLKIPIAIALAIAGLAAAYFLLLRPSAETPQEPIAVATPNLNEPPAAPNAVPAQSAPEQSVPAQSAPEQNAQAPAASEKQAAAADEGDDGKWRHSLQAMSSQNADEARQFADRLVRAGVPAYVVSANLGARGTWHRVRIGRFASSDEALRFAAEARARAKAAGVNLKDLNLCDYEKP